MGEAPLHELIRPCGPVTVAAAERRAFGALTSAARTGGWTPMLETAWPALAPVFGASPYLGALAVRRPDRLRRVLAGRPETTLRALTRSAEDCGHAADIEAAQGRLCALKGDLHLLCALADLGGVWTLTEVTAALSEFADAAVNSALRLAAREALEAGRLARLGEGECGPLPGLFVIAMGKLGGFELNYSSDIDISVFHEPERLPAAAGVDPARLAIRLTERVANLLQTRTAEGYVFRVDLRLRPDPSSTPVCVTVPAALGYYETVGQNWERAAFIKARPLAGDRACAAEFLKSLSRFVWRRNLDHAAIADIHAIKRQIHTYKVDDRLSAKGADLKLGRGGIREIEFYVQTQQLVLGGRQPDLRSGRTLGALAALAAAGQITARAAEQMARAYERLRAWEHRVQMVNDEQTHRLPEADPDRRRVAALSGFGRLQRFDSQVGRVLRSVNTLYSRLFAGEEPLSSRFGSLVFTGVEDDPETLQTLRRMGFSEPSRVSGAVRAWSHGRIAATRSERGRELFTRLVPRLLDAMAATGGADVAFLRFSDFFAALRIGVQVQSLFLAEPRLLELVVRIMAYAPRFAQTLARRPAALDALFDPGFFGPIVAPLDFPARITEVRDFEAAMDVARRLHREAAFRIGVQVLSGVASAETAGRAFADLADGVIAGLAQAAMGEVARLAGAAPGEVAVIALGGCGAREMSARSDLDLMTLYLPARGRGSPSGAGAETFFARFTQRLLAALSAPTAEGDLYQVDLQLRPSGTKGPVAVSMAAFETYYAGHADTWEFLAMTRARVVWATSPRFTRRAEQAIEAALRRPRDPLAARADISEMRALMHRERPAAGVWDMKMSEGGLVDIDFCAQYLQIVHGAGGGPLRPNTGEALVALGDAGLASRSRIAALRGAWTLQHNLNQLLKIALDDEDDPEGEPRPFRALLAKAGGARGFAALKRRIAAARLDVQAASDELFRGRPPA